MDAEKTIRRARTGLLLDYPFFGTLSLRLRLESAPIETFAVDGRTLFYSEKFLTTLTAPELKGVIAHEVMHCALGHHIRRGSRDPILWNIATDYVINLIITDAGLTLPDGCLLDEKWRGMSAEEIYSKLPPEEKSGKGGKGGKPGDGCGPTGELRDLPGNGPGKKPGTTPVERQASEEEWKIATTQAGQIARGRGKLPAGIGQLLGELLAPVVDWRAVLADFVRMSVCRDDYTWSRPNRRHVASGLYLPALHSEKPGIIAVAIDTSGSCYDALTRFMSEVQGISGELRTRVRLFACDAEAHDMGEFEPGEPLPTAVGGGGGTDFRPVFDAVADLDEEPACLVYLTDLEGSFPLTAPPYPVLWAVVRRTEGAPFGREVRIRD